MASGRKGEEGEEKSTMNLTKKRWIKKEEG
jgi:hypothetical protein